jgi:hypothetical protein
MGSHPYRWGGNAMNTHIKVLLLASLTTLALTPLATAGLLAPSVHDTTGAGGVGLFDTTSCGGSLPGTCSNGAHTYTLSLTHTCLGPSFTGTVTSILSYTGGAREFTCVFNGGAFVTSNGQGTFPPAGVTFTQTCVGVGVGTWGCALTWS